MMHGAGKALVPEMGGRWGGNEALTIAMVTRTCLLVIPFGHSIAAEDARLFLHRPIREACCNMVSLAQPDVLVQQYLFQGFAVQELFGIEC